MNGKVLAVKQPSLGESLPDNARLTEAPLMVLLVKTWGACYTLPYLHISMVINTGSAPGHRHLQLPGDLTRYLNIF